MPASEQPKMRCWQKCKRSVGLPATLTAKTNSTPLGQETTRRESARAVIESIGAGWPPGQDTNSAALAHYLALGHNPACVLRPFEFDKKQPQWQHWAPLPHPCFIFKLRLTASTSTTS